MPIAKENNLSSADRILRAATELFSSNAFNSVSVKDIAALSGANGALISYCYGGKKNLYQAVLNSEAMVFLNLIENVDSQPISPLEKICLYVRNVADIQNQNPNQVNLVYRELLMPSGFCDNFVQSKLFKIHQFILEQVSKGVEGGTISPELKPTHVAFTLESLIVFFFLTQDFVRDLGALTEEGKQKYLEKALESYLALISKN